MAKTNKRRDDERRTAAAAKVADMRREQQVAERRRRSMIVGAIVAAVIVVVVGVFIVVKNSGGTPTVASGSVGGTTGNYGIIVGKASAPVSMVAYEDFQCPICKQFEDTSGSMLAQEIARGKLKIEYRPIAFLDQESSTTYSTRALNAAACVVNYTNSATFKKFHDLLYANQPAEGSAGLPDSQLVAYAKQAGATAPDVASCISSLQFKSWTVSATTAASESSAMAGGISTPTVLLNGNKLNNALLYNPAQLSSVIESAASGKSQQ